MDSARKKMIRKTIREAGLTVFFSTLGLLVISLLKQRGFPGILGSVIALALMAMVVFILYPKALGIPFGRVGVREWVRRIGLHPPEGAWKHVLLGFLLAGCTLSGMWLASVMTGRYAFDAGNVTSSHLVFSLVPGIFEEIFMRGILMIILLNATRSIEKAFAIQIVLFGLMHIKGLDIISLVDALSVSLIAIGFTYSVYKTGSLMAAIVFHYLHDAFLFLVQVPDGVYHGFPETALFYAGLWSMIGVSLLVTKIATERLGVRAREPFYGRAFS